MNIQSKSILHQTALRSVLGDQSYINGYVDHHKKSIVADLLLTALIDAFSILVIFLLMNFSSNGEILYINKMELPKASQAEVLERNPIVKMENGQIYLEDKAITADELVAALLATRQTWQDVHPGEEYPGILIVQADRKAKYAELNGIVVAASQTGFSDIRFAVAIK